MLSIVAFASTSIIKTLVKTASMHFLVFSTTPSPAHRWIAYERQTTYHNDNKKKRREVKKREEKRKNCFRRMWYAHDKNAYVETDVIFRLMCIFLFRIWTFSSFSAFFHYFFLLLIIPSLSCSWYLYVYMCDVNQHSQQLQTFFFLLLLIRIIKVALYIYLVSNQDKTWQKIEAEKKL